MPDSDAVRSRRKRLHATGDCSLCRHVSRGGAQAALSVAAEADPCADPAGELAALAGRLAAAHRADPGNGVLARELRQTLQALMGGDPDAGLDVG
jgi:hypothetical protein